MVSYNKYGGKARLEDWIRFVKKKIKNNWDYVIVIDGENGVGKSHFMLHLVEKWYNNKPPGGRVGVRFHHFVKALHTGEKGDVVAFDEAGDELNSKKAMDSLNRDLESAYTVIRQKGYVTFLVLPSIWILNKYFRERRIRGLFNVYYRDDEKKVAYYRFFTRKRLNMIFGRNGDYNRKRLNVGVSPTFRGLYREYTGSLLEEYNSMKITKVDEVLDNLMDKYADGQGHVNPLHRAAHNLLKDGLPAGKVANLLGWKNEKYVYEAARKVE